MNLPNDEVPTTDLRRGRIQVPTPLFDSYVIYFLSLCIIPLHVILSFSNKSLMKDFLRWDFFHSTTVEIVTIIVYVIFELRVDI